MKSCDRFVRFPIYRISRIAVSLCLFAGLFVGLSVTARGKDKKLKADELIALHLESIGTAEARQKLASRTYTGQGIWRVVVGATGRLPGKVSLVSANGKISLDFDTGSNPSFYGEHFAFDGKNPHVKRSFQAGYSNFGKVGYPLHSGDPNILWFGLTGFRRPNRQRSSDTGLGQRPQPVAPAGRRACRGCVSCAG